MTSLRPGRSHPTNLPARFVLILAFPVGALVWLSFQFDAQDRQLEMQRAAERRELAIGRAVSSLEQLIAASERRLGEPGDPGAGAIRIHVRGESVEVEPPGRMAYYPTASPLPEATRQTFDVAEELEFRQADPTRAIEILNRLTVSSDPAVRAGSLVRLARNLKKTGRPARALEAYERLIATCS